MSKKVSFGRKSLFFFFFLTFVCSAFLFKGQVFHFVLKKYVAHKIPLKGDWDFNYSYISLQEKGVAFHDILLHSEDRKTLCTIGKIYLYAPLVENISLKNHFRMEDLEISFKERRVSNDSISSSELRSLLSTLKNVEIVNGIISIPQKKVHFSLDKSISSQKIGALNFWKESEGGVKIDLSTWADRLILDVEARQSNLVFYKEVIDFFAGSRTSKWKVENGKLDGTVFLALSSENTVQDARMHMNLLDGKLSNEEAGIRSSFDRIFLDVNYPISSKPTSVLENLKITSSVDKGEVCVFNQEGDSRFHFKDLSGFFTTKAFKEAAVEITGFIDDRGKLLPIHLVGNPAHKAGVGLELDLSLQLDPTFGQEARVHMICSRHDGDFYVKSELDSLEVRQMLILQMCMGLFYPEFRDYTLNNGSYSGEVFMAFDSEGIKDFSLRNLACENLSVYCSKYDVAVDAASVTGALQIDPFHHKATIFSKWELELLEGGITIGKEDSLPYYLENTNIKVTARDQKFIDSFITTELKGVRGRINIDGEITAPIFDFLLSGSGNDALSLFTEASGSYENELMLSARVEKREGDFEATGLLTLLADDLSSEVSFVSHASKSGIEDVAFQTKDISGKFFPFLNEVFKFDWSVDGTFSVDGQYSKDLFVCEIEGEDCTYRENHSFIKGAKGRGIFTSNLPEDKWSLDLHLTRGHKKIFGGNNLFLENADLYVSSEECFFKVRDFEGHIDPSESMPRLFLETRKFDVHKDGSIVADLSINNEDFELARFSGIYSDGKLHLDEYSHLLSKQIYLHECSLPGGLALHLDSKIDLNDIAFPSFVRKLSVSELFCSVFVKDDKYELSLKNEDLDVAIKGAGEEFSLFYGEEMIPGRFEGMRAHLGAGFIEWKGRKAKISSAEIESSAFNFEGTLIDPNGNFTGSIEGHFEDRWKLQGKGKGCFRLGEDSSYIIESIDEFAFSFDEKGLIEDHHFMLLEKGTMLGEFFAPSTLIFPEKEKISFHNLDGVISNDVLRDKTEVVITEDTFTFKVDADIYVGREDFWFSGKVDGREFIFSDRKLKAEEIRLRGNKKSLIADFKVPLYDTEVDITSHIFLNDKLSFHIDGFFEGKEVLEADGTYKDCLEIYRLKGDLLGAAFDITPSSEIYDSDFKVALNLDLEKMRVFLPEGVVEFIDRLSLKKGIEVIGEAHFKNGFVFDGLLKGTDFDMLDYSISSMFGKFSYRDGVCRIADFSVADRAFIASCEEVTLSVAGEGCNLDADAFIVKNLRPCLLSKKGERKKLSNPFMLEEINFSDITGNLTDLNTVTGKGTIKFINSFDKDTNPVFDFAKEIIARIGLDPVLMVPVVGELDFNLHEGKMNFTKMYNTFSDGARSYFFLWNKGPSYLDFDGNLHIDIRMKQQSLLRFTELFIISLDGPLSSPKVFLK